MILVNTEYKHQLHKMINELYVYTEYNYCTVEY